MSKERSSYILNFLFLFCKIWRHSWASAFHSPRQLEPGGIVAATPRSRWELLPLPNGRRRHLASWPTLSGADVSWLPCRHRRPRLAWHRWPLRQCWGRRKKKCFLVCILYYKWQKKFLWIQNLEPSNKLSGTRSCTGTRVRPCKFITLCRECVWCKMSFFLLLIRFWVQEEKKTCKLDFLRNKTFRLKFL